MTEKTYLGDSVYAEYDGHGITLTTEDDESVTNTICLNHEACTLLQRFARSISHIHDKRRDMTSHLRDLRRALQFVRDTHPLQMHISVDFGCREPGVCDWIYAAEMAHSQSVVCKEYRENTHRDVVTRLEDRVCEYAPKAQAEATAEALAAIVEATGETDA